jgi:hypothetical protein
MFDDIRDCMNCLHGDRDVEADECFGCDDPEFSKWESSDDLDASAAAFT